MNKIIYNLELGVLLPEDHSEYQAYNNVFDKKHAYYDETYLNGVFTKELISKAREYVSAGVDNTYAVLTACWVPDYLYDDLVKEINENGFIEESVDMLDGEQYKYENIQWSLLKTKDGLVENFIK